MNRIKNERTVYAPTSKLAADCMVVVSSVLEVNRKFLMVERMSGARTQLGFPQGRLRPGQGIGHCAVTRAEAEAGYSFVATHLIGIYESRDDAGAVSRIRVAVTGRAIARLKADPGNREFGILTNRWMSLDQISEERESLDSEAWYRCLIDYREGPRYPLNIFRMPAVEPAKKTAVNLTES
jgi:hypothetical protein